ncbi:MAG TPA: ABC transporter permease [Spirochaetes bacterium]|nr:ABC transporter permease [Spirochaetota bacterium]
MGLWVIETLRRALAFGTPLLLGTLGEIYTERAGVLNLGVEGMMVLGAFVGFVTTFVTKNLWLGFIMGALVGGAAAFVHAFLSITLKAIQVVSGLALTLFGLGLTGVLGRGWEGNPLKVSLSSFSVPYLKEIPILGPIIFTEQNVLVYIGIGLAFVLWFVLFRTSWGITIRSVGENPATADALGIDVSLVRYLCVVLGGLLAGAGGAYLSIIYRPSWNQGMTGGMGWIVIALTIFSVWHPLAALGGSYIFGSLFYLSFRLQPWVAPELLTMMPYLFTILAPLLLNTSKKLRRRMGEPAALGLPYSREEE